MAAIELRHVSKRFSGTDAVCDASFTIHDGELFILVGPSGCGKSTLLNLIVGLEEVSAGEILVDGRRVNELDPRERNMAMVFQSYAIYPHMSVRENLAFPLRLAGLPAQEIEQRVARAAALLDLTELLERRPRALSGGQRQRVAMGRAMVRKPGVFLLDEPLSNLDAKLRVQMRTEIARLQQRLGTTMVYVTHDQTEAMTLGDRIAVLSRGEVLQIGTPRELYEQPASLFVAGFIGSPAMNFLPARQGTTGLETPLGTCVPPPQAAARLQAASGPLITGFRAECLRPAAEGATPGPVFTARAEVVEWLGADLFVYFDVSLAGFADRGMPAALHAGSGAPQRRTLVARFDPDSGIREGDALRLSLDPARVLVFDAASGVNLGLFHC